MGSLSNSVGFLEQTQFYYILITKKNFSNKTFSLFDFFFLLNKFITFELLIRLYCTLGVNLLRGEFEVIIGANLQNELHRCQIETKLCIWFLFIYISLPKSNYTKNCTPLHLHWYIYQRCFLFRYNIVIVIYKNKILVKANRLYQYRTWF